MAYSREQQNAELDRMVARMVAEHNATQASRDSANSYCVSRQITGEPTEKNRVYRASDDCWKRGLRTRTVGIAPGTANEGTATVRVIHADGTAEIRSANSFRKENVHKKQRNARKVDIAHDAATSYQERLERFGAVGDID